MKHRVLLRRALPLAVLAAVLYSAGWPASAFFFQKDEAVPSVAAMTKNGPAAEPISFSEEDFVVEGSGKLDSIVITTLPDAAVGCLTLGAQGIQVGDVIAMEAVDGLRFTPLAAPAGLEAQFQFTPVFSDGRSGDAVTVELYLLAEANGAPVKTSPSPTADRPDRMALSYNNPHSLTSDLVPPARYIGPGR